MADEYEGYGSYWGGLGNPKKFREDVSSGDLKPIVKALDKLFLWKRVVLRVIHL